MILLDEEIMKKIYHPENSWIKRKLNLSNFGNLNKLVF